MRMRASRIHQSLDEPRFLTQPVPGSGSEHSAHQRILSRGTRCMHVKHQALGVLCKWRDKHGWLMSHGAQVLAPTSR